MENNYLVFLREEEYLAIQNNHYSQDYRYPQNSTTDVNRRILSQNLQDQGYFLVGEFLAFDVTQAIEFAKNYLKSELNRLLVENEKLKTENNQLKYRGYDKANMDKFILSEIDPYEILGVKKEDDISVIKARVNKIRGVFHPDKNGGDSSFIFRMISDAFEKIEKN